MHCDVTRRHQDLQTCACLHVQTFGILAALAFKARHVALTRPAPCSQQ